MVFIKPPTGQQEVYRAPCHLVLKKFQSQFLSPLNLRGTGGIIYMQNANKEGDVCDGLEELCSCSIVQIISRKKS